jgi:hypothetical protein
MRVHVVPPHERYLSQSAETRFISAPPEAGLRLVVVIPCHNEPDLLGTLQHLAKCNPPLGQAEVIAVINAAATHAEAVHEQNLASLGQVTEWLKNRDNHWLTVHLLHLPDLPRRHAGVGLARKIGMDEGLRRLADVGQADDGLLVCYDADCRCSPDYFTAIESHFAAHPASPGTSIHFEHPLGQAEMTQHSFGALGQALGQAEFEGITAYELHLRYHVRAQKQIGFPYAFQTIGSAMAVRAWAYVKQGGMNRRHAGEDFYFLQKISWLGQVTELTEATVFPSPRLSDRVPFGTGKAIGDFIESQKQTTYPLQAYQDVEWLIKQTEILWSAGRFAEPAPEPLARFLGEDFLKTVLPEIRKNSTDLKKFCKRFFRWFNAFRLMKYLNYARDEAYGPAQVEVAAEALLFRMGSPAENENAAELLKRYRQLDRDSEVKN